MVATSLQCGHILSMQVYILVHVCTCNPAILDLVTVQDWYKEMFAEGVGMKWEEGIGQEEGGGGGEGKILVSTPLPTPYPASAPNLYWSSMLGQGLTFCVEMSL